MRTRAAAALQKVLTFQDVRTRLEDVAPSTVAPLVGLLRLESSSKSKYQREGHNAGMEAARSTGETSPEQELRQPQRRLEGGGLHLEDHEQEHRKERPYGGWVNDEADFAEASRTRCQRGSKVTCYSRSCLCGGS